MLCTCSACKYTNTENLCKYTYKLHIFIWYMCKLNCISLQFTQIICYLSPEYRVKIAAPECSANSSENFEKILCRFQSVKSVCKKLLALFVCCFYVWYMSGNSRNTRNKFDYLTRVVHRHSIWRQIEKIWHRQTASKIWYQMFTPDTIVAFVRYRCQVGDF